ncbi:hypothetical protein AB0F13_01425 [Streptomyces sp. NPDC026206]|uniref:hypothetical protein n=1 Tax=Streptomyces sp. NPDC026206 TaxID=3157089 RepID=UPI0033FA0505
MLARRGLSVALCSPALTGSFLASSPASAAGGNSGTAFVCTGKENGSSTPGLGLLPRPTRLEADARYTCSGGPGRTIPATGHFVGSANASCVAVNSPTGREKIRYADGRRSVIDYTSSTVVRLSTVTLVILNGTVTEGRGKGRTARRTVATLATRVPAADCLLPAPVNHAAGGVQLDVGPA